MNKKLDDLLDTINNHSAPFYRTRWESARTFAELPLVSRSEFAGTPLAHRRYKEGEFVKIVTGGVPFLSEWSVDDIGREEFGIPSRRPMVYFTDAHEALEKAMWCYERGMVPLVGEKDPALASSTAELYEVDSLIIDEPSLRTLLPHLKTGTYVKSISILGARFSPDIESFSPLAVQVRLVLALPEIGAFAQAALEPNPRFQPLPGCVLEHRETLVVTKESLLVTPVIRFDTGIKTELQGTGFAVL